MVKMLSHSLKIGIITLRGLFNYGNRLQAYATQRIISGLGFETVTFETTDSSIKSRVKIAINKALNKPVRIEDTLSRERSKAFTLFNEHIKTYKTSIRDIEQDEYTYFVAGSDQVWNPSFMAYRHPEMLEFAPREKRVAFAASIGISQIREDDREWFARGVSGFEHISVREHRAVELVRELTGRNAELVIDPTLALSRDEWLSISVDSITPTTSYVFAYLLGGVGAESKSVLEKITRGVDDVIFLSDRERDGELPAGPGEFVSLIANARHVVTDSYHASVFALLMGIPLTIVRRAGSTPEDDMFARLESLANTLGLERCVHGSQNFDLRYAGDFARSYELLELERAKLKGYLARSLKVS